MMDDAEIRKSFDLFDKDGDGKITTDEVKAMLIALGDDLTDDEVAEIVKDADENSDGFVSFEEFVAAMGK
jgi:calmodulin